VAVRRERESERKRPPHPRPHLTLSLLPPLSPHPHPSQPPTHEPATEQPANDADAVGALGALAAFAEDAGPAADVEEGAGRPGVAGEPGDADDGDGVGRGDSPAAEPPPPAARGGSIGRGSAGGGGGGANAARGRARQGNGGGAGAPPPPPPSRPAPQKWVQCAACNLWRQVPYELPEDAIPDDWTCAGNVWDPAHAACAVPQALSDEAIDEILALQAGPDLAAGADEGLDEEDGGGGGGAFPGGGGRGSAGGSAGFDDGDASTQGGGDGAARPRGRAGGARSRQRSTGPARGRARRADGEDGGAARPRGRSSVGGRPGAAAAAAAAAATAAGGGVRPGSAAAGGPGMPGALAPPSRSRAAAQRGSRPGRGGRAGAGGAAAGAGRSVGRGLSEAAEALLGMGFGADEGDDGEGAAAAAARDDPYGAGYDGDGGDGDYYGAAAGVGPSDVDDGGHHHDGFPSHHHAHAHHAHHHLGGHPPPPPPPFRPGDAVWAKVEGHDWWPARVVRRRAVPREVGPPPGCAGPDGRASPAAVRAFVPVVFFTPCGLPGELRRGCRAAAVAAAAAAASDEDDDGDVDPARAGAAGRGLGAPGGLTGADGPTPGAAGIDGGMPPTAITTPGGGGPDADADEAEFAWLPGPALCTFELGPEGGPPRVNPDGAPAADSTLEACVRAAAAALAAAPKTPPPADAAADPGDADSDGGWGAAGSSGRRGGAASDRAPSVAAVLGWRAAGEEGGGGAPELLIHWTGRAHVHNEWAGEAAVVRVPGGRAALKTFRAAHGGAPCDLSDPRWLVPEKVVGRRPAPAGPGWEALVRWGGLPPDAATWEPEGSGVLAMPAGAALLARAWRQMEGAERRAAPGAAAAAAARAAALEEAARVENAGAPEGEPTGPLPFTGPWPPSWMRARGGAALLPHQRAAVEWLRGRWAAGTGAGGRASVLADAPGLGRAATALAWAHTLRFDGRDPRPVLIVCASAALAAWTAELAAWAPAGDVARLAGPPGARALVAGRELWVPPSALDGRSTFRSREGGRGETAEAGDGGGAAPPSPSGRVPRPDFVLTSFDAAASEKAALACLPWAAIVLDGRAGARRAVARGADAVGGGLDAGARLVLARRPYDGSSHPAERAAAAGFLWPGRFTPAEAASAAPDAPAALALAGASLRRDRAAALGAGPAAAPLPALELTLPVAPTADQAAAARAALGRALPALAATEGVDHADALRAACDEQLKLCAHAGLGAGRPGAPVPPVPPLGAPAAVGSAKLALAGRLLPRLRDRGARVLVTVAGGDRAVAAASDFCRTVVMAGGGEPDAVGVLRVDSPPADRDAALAAFNDPDGRRPDAWLLVAAARALGLGTPLPGATVVLAFDTAWSRRADAGALARARCLGAAGSPPPPIARLVIARSVEERLLSRAAPAPRRGKAGERAMEDALRWAADFLCPDGAGPGAAAAAAAVKKEGGEEGVKAEEAAEVAQAPGEAPPAPPTIASYTEAHLDAAADWLCSGAAAGAPGPVVAGDDPLPPGAVVCDLAADNAAAAGDDGGEDGDGDAAAAAAAAAAADRPGSGATTATAAAAIPQDAGVPPAYWPAALSGAAADAAAADAAEAAVTDAAPFGPGGLLHGRTGETEGEEAEDEMMVMGGDEGAATDDGRRGGGAHHAPRRRGRAPGGGRRRRLEDGPDDGGEAKRGRLQHDGTPPVGGGADGGDGGGGGGAGDTPLRAVPLPVVAREWALQETRMRLIADPLSAEGGVARRAYAKVGALVRQLGLPPGAGELARQAADVLLAGRPDGEPPSDFQDYTLLAVVAAAARLAGVPRTHVASDPRRLAAAHGHDPASLEAVLDYVMAALNSYRALCDRVRSAFGAAEDALAQGVNPGGRGSDGGGGGGGLPPHMQHLHAGSPGGDLDGFAARLGELVAGDFARAAADGGPLDAGGAPALPPPPPDVAASYEARAEYDAVAAQIRAVCDQIALLDRTHALRVAAVQDEYGRFMERVRALAQGAVDEANAGFQATRHGVTVHLDALVALFQARFYAGAGGDGGGGGSGDGGGGGAGAAGGGGAGPDAGPAADAAPMSTDGGDPAAEAAAAAAAALGGGPGGLASQAAAALAARLGGQGGGGGGAAAAAPNASAAGLPLQRLSAEQMASLAAQAGGRAPPPPAAPSSSAGGSAGGGGTAATVRAGGAARTVLIDDADRALLDAAAREPARMRSLDRGAGGGVPASPRAAAAAAAAAAAVHAAALRSATASPAASPRAPPGGHTPFARPAVGTAPPGSPRGGGANGAAPLAGRESSLRDWEAGGGAGGASAGGEAAGGGSPFAFKPPPTRGPPSPAGVGPAVVDKE